jgi:hypothetical protein
MNDDDPFGADEMDDHAHVRPPARPPFHPT